MADLVIMLAAAAAWGGALNGVERGQRPLAALLVPVLALAVTLAVGGWCRLYAASQVGRWLPAVPRVVLAVLAGGACASLLLFLLGDRSLGIAATERPTLAWAASVGAMMLGARCLLAWRLRVLSRAGRFAIKLAIVGRDAGTGILLQDTARDAGFRAVGVFDDGLSPWPDSAADGLRRGSVADLVAYARTGAVDAIVITRPAATGHPIDEVVARLRGIAADIYLSVDDADRPQGVRLAGSPVIRLSARPLDDQGAFRKMLFDRIVSAALLIVAAPLLACLAVLVKLDSPGPFLFRQTREGLNGSSFVMLKVRTMYCGCHAEHLQATRRDRRVTRVGRWLRRYSLDELPQLLNVLAGDMSLVGPRPHLATTRAGNLLLKEAVPDYEARQRMKPGMTGWAQVHGLRGETRTVQDVAARVAHDLYYIDNWSLRFDAEIILRTLMREIFSRSGKAY